MHTDYFSYTDFGGRDENQDTIGVAVSANDGLYIVADGLGGHRLGNLASQMVVSSLTRSWESSKHWSAETMQNAIEKANNEVLAMQRERICNAKSTVVILSLQSGRAIWAHSGDSRLYYISKNTIAAFTEDHSVAYMKYKTGEITREQIAEDEDQSSLLRALGNESRWTPSISEEIRTQPGDAFLLCSDGLWEYVTDNEILALCKQTKTAEDWGKSLLEQASCRYKPGHDNLSFIVIKITD